MGVSYRFQRTTIISSSFALLAHYLTIHFQWNKYIFIWFLTRYYALQLNLKKKKKMENLQLCTYFTDNVLGDIE